MRTSPRFSAIALGALVAVGCQESQIVQPRPGLTPGDAQTTQLQQLGFGLASISAGHGTACGLTAIGQAYCWGDNSNGQFGNGTSNPSSVPVAASGGITFTTISGPAGLFGDGTCALAKSGPLYCWGAGLLGDGAPFSSDLVPTVIADTLVFTSISVDWFTCGVVKSGQAYCWGIDGEGELGNASSTPGVNFNYPVAVLGGLTFSAVSAGGLHACGLTKGGQAYCWGSNGSGELGTGAFTTGSNVPVAVSTGLAFTQLSAGLFHNCALTKDGTAYCWGSNSNGQLGTGSINAANVPTPVAGGIAFASIVAGDSHTCGITKAGVAYCWGSNFYGETGTGSAGVAPILSPVQVAGGFTFASLSAGENLTCGITVRLGAFCWGNNSSGQIGNGSTAAFFDSPSPVATP